MLGEDVLYVRRAALRVSAPRLRPGRGLSSVIAGIREPDALHGGRSQSAPQCPGREVFSSKIPTGVDPSVAPYLPHHSPCVFLCLWAPSDSRGKDPPKIISYRVPSSSANATTKPSGPRR
jgi:hypothetical protein